MSKAYIPKKLREQITQQSGYRCGYCLTSTLVVGFKMQVDHIIPEAAGGATTEDNLWLACKDCNGYKSDKLEARDPITGKRAPIYHPRNQVWKEHFEWADEWDVIYGRTATGRATVEALRLNRAELVAARRVWVAAGLHPNAPVPALQLTATTTND